MVETAVFSFEATSSRRGKDGIQKRLKVVKASSDNEQWTSECNVPAIKFILPHKCFNSIKYFIIHFSNNHDIDRKSVDRFFHISLRNIITTISV